MSYELQAVIGGTDPVADLASRYLAAHLVELAQGFSLVPLTDELTREMGEAFQLPLLVGEELPMPLERACRHASQGDAAIAYVECESEAGPFWQASVVWQKGDVVLGPLVDLGLADDPRSSIHGPPTQERHEQPAWPINRALRRLGVEAAYEPPSENDEFEVVGLSRYRLTREWAEGG